MKKVLFTTATAFFFLISCSDSSTTPATPATASTDSSQGDKNLANNRKVFAAIETGDSSTINSLIADDAVDHNGGANGTEMKGGDSIKHMLADMHNHFKDLKMDIIADAAKGDYIFALNTITGTTTDASMGMPAGMKMNEKGVDVIRVKDGKMAEHWVFLDPAEMMKQMKEMPMDNSKTKKK